tara:strand:- start:394 stop:1626 length:1233 start_codon:yes stop_codon:yes gene_type:complete
MEFIGETTSLKKISKLKGKYRVVPGAMGSSKTFSILLILINHASTKDNKTILIASKELTKMRLTVIKDFVSIMKYFRKFNPDHFIGGTLYRFRNGSTIKFIGLDKEDLGRGLRSDVVFINECNKVNYEAFRELTARTKVVFLDYNPTNLFWVDSELLGRDNCETVTLTYKDNEYCPAGEVAEILSYKERGFDADGHIINEFYANKYNVYGLGLVGGIEGAVYSGWKEISYQDFRAIDRKSLIGLDWGIVDPCGIVEIKYYDGNLYVHELNYDSETKLRKRFSVTQLQAMGEDGMISFLFTKLGIPKDYDIICDSARKSGILNLRHHGWERAVGARKGPGSILDGISIIQGLRVHYTSSSTNLRNEYLAYQWSQDRNNEFEEKPEDQNNHICDALRYGVMYLRNIGVINIV